MFGSNKKQAEAQAAQLKQYQDMVKTLGEQLDAAKKGEASMQARVKQLESDIATLKREDLNEDQKAAQMLKSAQAESQKHASEAAAARNEVTQLKARIAQLENDLKTAEASAGDGDGAPDRPAIKYTVVSGDNLRAIAQRFYGNEMEYMRIFHANRDQLDNPDLIHPGQVLNVP
jgi:nucleoid-associated protein YgaU